MPYAKPEDQLAYYRRRLEKRRAARALLPVTPAQRRARHDDQMPTTYMNAVYEFTMWCRAKKLKFRDAMAAAMAEYREAHA